MRNRKLLPFFIAIEGFITGAMIVDHNWYAAMGWGILMLTNLGILNEKKD
jgi:hypothetical protein